MYMFIMFGSSKKSMIGVPKNRLKYQFFAINISGVIHLLYLQIK